MALLTSVFRALNPRAVRAYEALPGPAPSLPLGNLPDFLGRPTWDVVADYSERHGGAAVAWLGSRPVVCVGSRAGAEHVLFGAQEDFVEPHPTAAFAPDSGAPWREDPSLHLLRGRAANGWLEDCLPALAPLLSERAEALLEESEGTDQPQRLLPPLRRVTFDALSVALVGRELGAQAFADLDQLARRHSHRLVPPADGAGTPDVASAAAAARWRHAWAKPLSEAERFPGEGPGGAPENRSDLLGRLLREDSPLDRALWPAALAELCAEQAWLVPSIVATALHLLGTHPDWAERLRTSLDSLSEAPGPAELRGHAVLDAVLRESLRQWSPLPLSTRRALPGAGLSPLGPPLPEDATVLVSAWTLLRNDEQTWGEVPTAFRPERWNLERRERRPLGGTDFFPLGAGPRVQATSELTLSLARLFLAQWLRVAAFRPPVRQLPSAGERVVLGVRVPKGLRATVERA